MKPLRLDIFVIEPSHWIAS